MDKAGAYQERSVLGYFVFGRFLASFGKELTLPHRTILPPPLKFSKLENMPDILDCNKEHQNDKENETRGAQGVKDPRRDHPTSCRLDADKKQPTAIKRR